MQVFRRSLSSVLPRPKMSFEEFITLRRSLSFRGFVWHSCSMFLSLKLRIANFPLIFTRRFSSRFILGSLCGCAAVVGVTVAATTRHPEFLDADYKNIKFVSLTYFRDHYFEWPVNSMFFPRYSLSDHYESLLTPLISPRPDETMKKNNIIFEHLLASINLSAPESHIEKKRAKLGWEKG